MRTPPLVLVVDDDKANVDILATRLRAHGYAIVTAGDGEEALAAVSAHGPDLVLLDVNMPRLDGLEVCRRLKADPALPFTPIILVTARADSRDVVTGLEAGADEYLTKPVDGAALVARVRSMLRMKALHERVQAQADERLGRLKRFFSPAVADLIVGGDADDLLRTHRREVAMVVTDLTGFVPFAETAEPEEILGLLREYHAAMGRLVLGHGATLERIVVDAVVAVFNAPVEVADPAGRAVRLAVALRERARELNAAWRRRGWDLPVRVGVGLGYATIGAVGFEERLDYAVVGHVAAVSAFLCDAAGPDDILVALRVATAVETLADLEEIASIERPGLCVRSAPSASAA